jgi:hypothetical protein
MMTIQGEYKCNKRIIVSDADLEHVWANHNAPGNILHAMSIIAVDHTDSMRRFEASYVS